MMVVGSELETPATFDVILEQEWMGWCMRIALPCIETNEGYTRFLFSDTCSQQ